MTVGMNHIKMRIALIVPPNPSEEETGTHTEWQSANG
jgi:hypothetical protein